MKQFLLYSFFVLLLVVTMYPAYCQKNIGDIMISNKSKGDQYFLDLYYEKAIEYYLRALKNYPNDDAMKLRIGDSYRLLSEYERAEYWYSQVMDNNPEDQKPFYAYQYANMLLIKGEYNEALKWFEIYKAKVPDDSRTSMKISGIDDMTEYFIDSSIIEINKVSFNTSFSEVSPMMHNNSIVFLSNRKSFSLVEQDYLRKEDLYDLYTVSYDSAFGWRDTREFDKNLNTPYHEGPVSFYTGEDRLLLTRSNYLDNKRKYSDDGKTRLQLFYADKNGGEWSTGGPFELNSDEYSIAHPALNQTNDTLFFASDMPGGIGGTDLYMSVFNNNRWSEPINLGTKVNTEGNELFPSYISNRLFFSSDGRDGLGGLDIYKAALHNGTVRYVANIGGPINSSMDDFSYLIDPETNSGYFASNRLGGEGSDDIYSFNQKALILAGIAIQEQDGTPLSGVRINLFKDGVVIATTITGEDGSFRFQVPFSSDFKITAEKEEHSFEMDLHVSTGGNRVDIDTLLIQLHKDDFFARGLVYDTKSQEVMSGVKVIIEDEATHQKDSVETGMDGMYSFVIKPGKEYILWVEKDRFSSDSTRINTFSISQGTITNDFVLEEDFIEKITVFFDYDKYNLRSEDNSSMQKAMEILKEHPNDWLVIGAHADSRGTREYNQELSEKRASTVLEYFTERGISKDKIIARGFGEGLLINRCVDGVNCREEDHSKNRRAEIVITKKLPMDELQNKGF